MIEDQKEELEEMLKLNEKLFTGFLLLRALVEMNKKAKVRNDLAFVYENYSYLLAERKNYLETEKKLKAINGFMGLR